MNKNLYIVYLKNNGLAPHHIDGSVIINQIFPDFYNRQPNNVILLSSDDELKEKQKLFTIAVYKKLIDCSSGELNAVIRNDDFEDNNVKKTLENLN